MKKEKEVHKDFIQMFRYKINEYKKEGYSLVPSVVKTIEYLKRQDDINSIIKNLEKCTFKFPDHAIAFGYAFIIQGILESGYEIWGERNLYVRIVWYKPAFRKAIVYLSEASKMVQDCSLICFLLSFALKMIEDFEHSNDMFKKFDVLAHTMQNVKDKEYIAHIQNSLKGYMILKNAELYIEVDDKVGIAEVKEELKSLFDAIPTESRAVLLLARIFERELRPDNYCNFIEEWTKKDNNPIAFETLARLYLQQKRYDIASEYFERAKMLYDYSYRKGVCAVLKELSSGLNELCNVKSISKTELSSVYKHFNKITDLIEQYDVEFFDDLKLISSILVINNQTLNLLTSSKSLHTLRAKVDNLFSRVQEIFSQWKSVYQYYHDEKVMGDPATNLLIFTSYYLDYLGSILKISKVLKSEKNILKETGESIDIYWKKNFKLMNKIWVEKLGLKENKAIFDTLYVFKEKINGRSMDEIASDEAETILNSFRKKSIDMGGNVIYNVVDKLIIIKDSTLRFSDQPPRTKNIIRCTSQGIDKKNTYEKKVKDKKQIVKVPQKLKPFKPEEEKFMDLENPSEYEPQDFLNELETIFGVDKSNFQDILWEEWLINFVHNYKKIINSTMPILLEGEKGSGKSFLAEKFHLLSNRCGFRYLALNCMRFGDNEPLAEGELFGYKKGAFTGAYSDKEGFLEAYDHGSICLENIENLPLTVQNKLLVYLDHKMFIRLGETIERKSDVRFFMTYVKDIVELINKEKFSDQLYSRIQGCLLRVPSLGERNKKFKFSYAKLFITKHCLQEQKIITHISEEVIKFTENYSWQLGNLRELENIIEKSIIESQDKINLSIFLSFMKDERQIEEIWHLYGKDFRNLKKVQKEILLKPFNLEFNTQNITGKYKFKRQKADVLLEELEKEGFIEKTKTKKGRGGVDHFRVRYPFEI